MRQQKRPIQRTILMQILSLRIRFAAISEKLIIPRRQVNAKRQKHNVTRKCNDSVHCSSRSQHSDRFRIFRKFIKSLPVFRIRTGPAMSHNYHKSGKCADHNGIQKKTPREAITPCSHGCFASAAAADIVIVP